MSAAGGRRRRRRGRRGASLAGDPLDLFLDAITNALGVIMFILLMVVLFGRASEAPPVERQSREAAAEARRLEESIRELEARIDALPPAGDPELAARWKAAMERVPRLDEELAQARAEADRAEREAEEARARLEEAQAAADRLAAEAASVATSARRPTGFVRVSRFQQDARKSVILALSGGMLSRVRATADTKEISAPAAGAAVTDAASAADAVRRTVDGFLPATHRVELLVWQGSFREAKLVEQALLDLGFDCNPLPARAGTSIQSGAGGVQ